MLLLAVPILAVLAFFLVIISSFVSYILFSRFNGQVQVLIKEVKASELLVSELQLDSNTLRNRLSTVTQANEKNILENEQVSKQLEHRIKIIQQNVNEQQTLISQWKENQSQDKFYSRAFRLAEKGADIEEIMCECELPRAEVEMLLSVYQQRTHL